MLSSFSSHTGFFFFEPRVTLPCQQSKTHSSKLCEFDEGSAQRGSRSGSLSRFHIASSADNETDAARVRAQCAGRVCVLRAARRRRLWPAGRPCLRCARDGPAPRAWRCARDRRCTRCALRARRAASTPRRPHARGRRAEPVTRRRARSG